MSTNKLKTPQNWSQIFSSLGSKVCVGKSLHHAIRPSSNIDALFCTTNCDTRSHKYKIINKLKDDRRKIGHGQGHSGKSNQFRDAY